MCDHKTAEMKYQLVFRRHCMHLLVSNDLLTCSCDFMYHMKVTEWAGIDINHTYTIVHHDLAFFPQ